MIWRILAAFVGLSLIWGSVWIVQPLIFSQLPPFLTGALRFAAAAALLALLALSQRPILSTRPPFQLAPSCLLGITMIGLPYVLTVWAARRAASSNSAVIYSAMPLAVLLMSGESVLSLLPALAAGLAGVALLVSRAASTATDQVVPAILVMLAVISGAFSLNYARRQLAVQDLIRSSALQFAVAAIGCAILSALEERAQPIHWQAQSLAALAITAVVASAAALPLYYWLLRHTGAVQAGALEWSITLAAVAESVLFLRARPPLTMWAGAALIAAATIAILRRGRETPPVTLLVTSRPSVTSASSESKGK
jgi:drug/metabolite transporter (DMT)-like permease